MELTQIGRIGKPHGTAGELKAIVEEHFEDDLLAAKVLFVGTPAFPHFIEQIRMGGMVLLKLEDIDRREMASLLSNQPIFLPTEHITAEAPPDDHPYTHLIGWYIAAEGYEQLGPIVDVLDMPEHYLALLEVAGKDVFIPLHDDLVIAEDPEQQLIRMELPLGLLDVDQLPNDEA